MYPVELDNLTKEQCIKIVEDWLTINTPEICRKIWQKSHGILRSEPVLVKAVLDPEKEREFVWILPFEGIPEKDRTEHYEQGRDSTCYDIYLLGYYYDNSTKSSRAMYEIKNKSQNGFYASPVGIGVINKYTYDEQGSLTEAKVNDDKFFADFFRKHKINILDESKKTLLDEGYFEKSKHVDIMKIACKTGNSLLIEKVYRKTALSSQECALYDFWENEEKDKDRRVFINNGMMLSESKWVHAQFWQQKLSDSEPAVRERQFELTAEQNLRL